MRTREELTRALDSRDPEERRQAVAELAAHPPEDAVDHLMQGLGDEDWRVRKEATTVAITLGSERVVQSLIEALGPADENVGRRNAAVEALAGYGRACVEALSGSVALLDADGRKLAAEALGRSGEDSAVVVLKSMIRDDDPNVRAAVVEALAIVGATSVDSVAPLLTSYLDDGDRLLCLTALTGLNDLGVAVEWSRLVGFLADPVLRSAALVAAGRRADPEAAPVLLGWLERARGATYDTVVGALVDFLRAGPSALAALQAAAAQLPSAAHERLHTMARHDPGLERRRRAMLLSAALGTEAAARIAVEALRDELVATEAEEAIVTLGTVAVGPLLDRIATEAAPERAVCIDLLGQVVDATTASRAAAVLYAALQDPAEEVVAACLTVLGAIGDARSLPAAARALVAPSARVRRAAAQALPDIARRHRDASLSLVRDAAPDGPDAHAATLVIGALGSPVLGSIDADVTFLSEALSHESSEVRRAALDALAALQCERAVEAVAFALTDEVPSVRTAAVRALGRMRSDTGAAAGVTQLLELVERTTDAELVATAAAALGDTADPRALEALRALVRKAAPLVAVSAIDAVAHIEHPDRLDALIEGLWHDDTEVVKAALQRLGNEAGNVRSHLIACLDHEAWDVRRLAADLLARHGGEGTMARLRQRLAREAEPLVKEALQRALIEIESSTTQVRRTTSPPLRGGSNH